MLSLACIFLHSNTLQLMIKHSQTSIIFPSVVFANSLIVNSVVIFSAVLGYCFFDIILRIFNTILLTLFFVCGCLTARILYETDANFANAAPIMLIIQTVLAFTNCLLYIADIVINIKKLLKEPTIPL